MRNRVTARYELHRSLTSPCSGGNDRVLFFLVRTFGRDPLSSVCKRKRTVNEARVQDESASVRKGATISGSDSGRGFRTKHVAREARSADRFLNLLDNREPVAAARRIANEGNTPGRLLLDLSRFRNLTREPFLSSARVARGWQEGG